MDHQRPASVGYTGAVLSLLLCLTAFVWGALDYLVSNATGEIAATLQGNQRFDGSRFEELDRNLNVVHRYRPFDAGAYTMHGRLYEIHGQRYPAWSEEARSAASRAAEYYRTALRYRPVDGLAWAGLASVRALEADLDPEFFLAFDKAMTFAPWQVEVQDVYFRTGMQQWSKLPEDTRTRFLHKIDGALRHALRGDFVVKTAFFYRWEENIESLLKTQSQIDQYQRFQRSLRGASG